MKQLAKETAVYGLSSIIGRILNWMLVPVYVRVLADTGEYGVVTNLYGWTALLLVILIYGMETGFFRFINKKEEQTPMRVYATALYSVASTSLLFFVACGVLFLQPVSRSMGYAGHPEYIAMMAGIVATDAVCSIPFAYLRYRNRAMRFAAIKLAGIGLNIFLNLFFLLLCPQIHKLHPEWIDRFYHADYGVGYIFVSNVCTSLLTLLLLIPDLLPGLRTKPDFRRLQQLLRYSFPILILGVAGILNQTADKILFPFLFADKAYAEAQLGIYGACFKIAVVMVMFIQAFRYAYEPFIFAKNRTDDRKSNVEAMKYFILLALLIFLGVMFYLDVLKYFVKPAYYPGLTVVPTVMLGELFFGIYFNLSLWYKLTDRTIWGAVFSLAGCAVTVAVILLFVPRYGFIACAWASFASNLLMMLASYFIGQKKYPVAYDLRSAAFYVLLAAGVYLAGMLPQIESVYLRLPYRTVLLLLFAAVAVKRDLPVTEIPYLGRYFKK